MNGYANTDASFGGCIGFIQPPIPIKTATPLATKDKIVHEITSCQNQYSPRSPQLCKYQYSSQGPQLSKTNTTQQGPQLSKTNTAHKVPSYPNPIQPTRYSAIQNQYSTRGSTAIQN